MKTERSSIWRSDWLIWFFAFGYFAAYVPYSALSKAVSEGYVSGSGRVDGMLILPTSVVATLVVTYLVMTILGWWKYAHTFNFLGFRLPRPGWRTALSGFCTGLIIVTTTLSYTVEGVSIVFAMLLMRGGVLILSPIIDAITRRHVRWFSWAGLILSLASLFVSFAAPPKPGTSRFDFNLFLAIDVLIYLASYFVRLRFMTTLAKSDDPAVTKRYFVEEQLIAAPGLLLMLAVLAFGFGGDHNAIGAVAKLHLLRDGFTEFWSHPALVYSLVVGACSSFTGLFGALVLLDRNENAFAVPVNRCASVIAGLGASALLYALFSHKMPSGYELAGAGVILLAIVFLTVAPQWDKRRKAVAAKPTA